MQSCTITQHSSRLEDSVKVIIIPLLSLPEERLSSAHFTPINLFTVIKWIKQMWKAQFFSQHLAGCSRQPCGDKIIATVANFPLQSQLLLGLYCSFLIQDECNVCAIRRHWNLFFPLLKLQFVQRYITACQFLHPIRCSHYCQQANWSGIAQHTVAWLGRSCWASARMCFGRRWNHCRWSFLFYCNNLLTSSRELIK